MLEHALAAGIAASGADAFLAGVITTPGVAYVTRLGGFSFGIMVSASHNLFQDNGIEAPSAPLRGEIGRVQAYPKAVDVYADHLALLTKSRLDGVRVALDCANGSTSSIAERVFRGLGASVGTTAAEPDGENINLGCGSTHVEALCDFVREGGFDLGFAFDGDADRCIAVDGNGNVVDGDQIMYLCALDLRTRGRLANNTVVTTVMSNYGLH